MLKPNFTTMGFALFLAANASAVWGGVFPFLSDIQTSEVMFWFYLAQSVMLFLVFILSGFSSLFIDFVHLRIPVCLGVFAPIYFLGWAILIAIMYMNDQQFVLVIVSGMLLGTGAGVFYLLWHRQFASAGQDNGMRRLVMGYLYAVIIFTALNMLPGAVVAYMVPLICLPAFSLALALGDREVDNTHPMFSDPPLENLHVYRKAVASTWRSILCMGAFALCAGMERSFYIEQSNVSPIANLISMGTLFVGALIILLLWRFKSLKLNLIKLYRFIFPLLIASFIALPFAQSTYAYWLSTALFTFFIIGIVLTMMQCLQIANDRGVNPTFAFGIFGGIVWGLHDIGFITGTLIDYFTASESDSIWIIAIVSLYLLASMFFVSAMNPKNISTQLFYGDTIELLAPVETVGAVQTKTGVSEHGVFQSPVNPVGVAQTAPSVDKAQLMQGGMGLRDQAPERPSQRERGNDDDEYGVIRDRIDKQVASLRETYHLSRRESEVVSLIVRGNTVPRIAEKLYISENTVRTHMKRIYSKLDVHKKQDLIAMVERF